MASIKKNFAYSSILTISGYIFPLITFPYVTRVLGVANIGIYNFVDSTISYFSVIALLGINTVGIREIAKAKGNKDKLSNVYSSLLCLNLITTILAIIVLLLMTILVPKFHGHQEMFYIGTARLLFNSLLIEWLYRGLENFKYITNRSILVKCIYVAAVFIFVREKNDYVVYYLLTVLTFVVNAFINLIYSRRFVSFSLKGISIKPFIAPFLILGFYQILTSMYISFNVTFLGIKCGEIEVGYYTTATKLYAVIISFFSAFTWVMLPRLSSIVENNDMNEFKRLINKSIDALLAFVMPVIVITELYAPQIIRIIAGEGYEGAVIPMRIVMPLMLLIGYEQVIITQMLSPLKKDKAILINSLAGATVAMILNFLIVPKLASIGTSIVWVAAEIAVTISAQLFVYKYIKYQFPAKKILLRISSIIPVWLLCVYMDKFIYNPYIMMVLGSFLTFVYYFVLESFLFKNEVITSNVTSIKIKCERLFH